MPRYFLLSFKSIDLLFQEKKFNIDFQDGYNLGFPIRVILATSDLQVTSIQPMKFRVKWPFDSEEKATTLDFPSD